MLHKFLGMFAPKYAQTMTTQTTQIVQQPIDELVMPYKLLVNRYRCEEVKSASDTRGYCYIDLNNATETGPYIIDTEPELFANQAQGFVPNVDQDTPHFILNLIQDDKQYYAELQIRKEGDDAYHCFNDKERQCY